MVFVYFISIGCINGSDVPVSTETNGSEVPVSTETKEDLKLFYCSACNLFKNIIAAQKYYNVESDKIIKTVEDSECYNQSNCFKFVEHYAPKMLELLERKFPLSDICKELKLCTQHGPTVKKHLSRDYVGLIGFDER